MFCSQAPKLQTWSKVFLHCYIPVIHNVYMLLYGKLSQFCCLQNRKGYRIHWWIQKGVGVGGGGFGGSNLILFYFEHMTCYKTFYIYLKAIFPSIIILYKCFKKLSYLKKVVQRTNVIYIFKKNGLHLHFDCSLKLRVPSPHIHRQICYTQNHLLTYCCSRSNYYDTFLI